jgi:anti-sigma B factor antagonist
MSLQISSREVNHVIVLQCDGRIVAGREVADLESEITKHRADYRNVVLNLSGVDFLDSSGLGLLVRLATSTRNARNGIRFCCPHEAVRKVVNLTLLDSVLKLHETEENALASLRTTELPNSPGEMHEGIVLCADDSTDLVAYLREGLSRAGYRVQSACSMQDASILLKALRPKALVAGPRFVEKLSSRAAETNTWIINLGQDFARKDAGEALRNLVTDLNARLRT